jgi:hypothetical protein
MADTETTTVSTGGAAVGTLDSKAAADIEALKSKVEELTGHVTGKSRALQELLDATGAKNVDEAKRILAERKAPKEPPAEPKPPEAELEVPDREDPQFFDANGTFKKADWNRAQIAFTREVSRRDRQEERSEEDKAAVDERVAAEFAKLPEAFRKPVKGWASDVHPLELAIAGFAYHMNNDKPPTAAQIATAAELMREMGAGLGTAIVAGENLLAAANAAEGPPTPGPAKPGTTKVESEATKVRPDMTGDELQLAIKAKMEANRAAR